MPVRLVQIGAALADDVGGDDVTGVHGQSGEQTLDEGLGHVAAAEEGEVQILDHGFPLAHPWRSGRGPKMAVPTRTSVAPSSMATS